MVMYKQWKLEGKDDRVELSSIEEERFESKLCQSINSFKAIIM